MFRAGDVALTVCPSRTLADAGWAYELVDWWLWSVVWDGTTGMPSGPPRWPFRGGLIRQPARLVQAAKILRSEWPAVRASGKEEARP